MTLSPTEVEELKNCQSITEVRAWLEQKTIPQVRPRYDKSELPKCCRPGGRKWGGV